MAGILDVLRGLSRRKTNLITHLMNVRFRRPPPEDTERVLFDFTHPIHSNVDDFIVQTDEVYGGSLCRNCAYFSQASPMQDFIKMRTKVGALSFYSNFCSGIYRHFEYGDSW